MESFFDLDSPNFAGLRQRLIDAVNLRINNGEFTERGLARILGISQPQLHNVLKGARKLSPETADLILGKLRISVLDLLSPRESRTDGLQAIASRDLLALSEFAQNDALKRKPASGTVLRKSVVEEIAS